MQNKIQELVLNFAKELKGNGFKGNFSLDKPTRLLNSTDNSIYEVLPLAVAQPFNSSDVKILLELANYDEYKSLYFCARGGGTGTNGQSLTDGIVIDFSRHMTRVLEFNPTDNSITVEPGVILSDLNRMLASHGLFYAPNVSTADRATIGGMIATDAAGKGSLIYGKTSDSLLGVEFYLPDGSLIDTINSKNEPKFASEIKALLAPVQDEIAKRFPPLKRPLSGYNIRQCYQNEQFNFEYLISGSEGTLGIVTAAKLKLLPIPKFKALMVVHYDSFVGALRDADFLIKFSPLAIEAVDEKVQKSAQTLPNWPQLAKLLNSEGKNYISNFVEFVADTQDELDETVQRVQNALNARNSNYVTILEHNQINQLWSIRSLAVGLVGKLPGVRKPIAFVEDAIVPPHNLADFVEELQSELDKQNFTYAMYGHVDVGCIHVRPALNMQDKNDRDYIRPITEQVITLLNKYQGILWGEHGKGYRGEFVPHVFGEVLYPILCQIKALFDPSNRLNPGKLTAPSADIKLQRIELVPMRGELDEKVSKQDQTNFANAMLCNGNAACFNKDPANVMCPSYKVTNDRVHSPKGRATLVKEWLRAKASGDRTLEKNAAKDAFDALQGCLGCKACVGKCPTQVSIPEIRTKFLSEYHEKYTKRSLRDTLLARIEVLLPLAAKFPKLYNLIANSGVSSIFGVSKAPVIKSKVNLTDYILSNGISIYDENINPEILSRDGVVIFTDVFTGFLENNIVIATIDVIKKLGFKPYIIYPRNSGKSLIWSGDIDKFIDNSDVLAKLLNPIFERGITVVGLENTITTMFRDEMSKFAKPLTGKVETLAEFIAKNIDGLKILTSDVEYRLLPHCTEQALMPSESMNWQKIYTSLGAKLEVKNLGCCGMAGTYGHLSENVNNSDKLFVNNWQNTTILKSKINLATGFSCRSQASKLANVDLKHPIEIVNQLLK